MIIKAGDFTLDLWLGGQPIWASIEFNGTTLHGIDAENLDDLLHVVTKALRKVAETKAARAL